jgi:thiamine-monophosphate kinase
MIAERLCVHAAIDISDGLALDLSRMMAASGTGCRVRLADVPVHDDAIAMAARPGNGRSPLEHALADGEDFELLLAMPAVDAAALVAEPPASLRPAIIGTVTDGSDMVACEPDGHQRVLQPTGFIHAFNP